MNGVRRLLGATTSPSPPPPAQDPPPLESTSLPFVKAGPSWPPQSPAASPKQTTLGESFQNTAALFLGKKDKSKPTPPPGDEVTIGSPYSTTRPLNGSPPKHSSRTSNGKPSSSPGHLPRNGSISGPSSPVIPNRIITRKSVNKSLADPEPSPGSFSVRDELLMSLLASEAVVECRNLEVLTSEEAEDLKKEEQVLNARLVAARKKLGLEVKIRDAAISLSKVNAPHKRVSRQTEDQLEAANRRVDSAQKELWSISERVNEIHRRLMDHRAGVLSYSVRSMEKTMAVSTSSDSGYGSNRSTIMSPTSTSATGTSVVSPAPKFDGAHLFSGHIDAVVPRKPLSLEAAASEIAILESRLKAATKSLAATSKQQAEMARELTLARLEKQEAETLMSLDLQSAEGTILALEKELPRLEGLDAEVQELLQEKEEWERERSRLEERSGQVEALQARIADLEMRSGEEAVDAEKLLVEARERSRRQLEQKDRELQELQLKWELERSEWEAARAEWERTRVEWERDQQRREETEGMWNEDRMALQKVNRELDEGLAGLQRMIKEHGIVLFSRDASLKGLLGSVGSHLETVHSRLEGYRQAEADWSTAKRKLEEDVRAGLDKREALVKELEDARRERDFAKRETRSLKERDSARSSPVVQTNPMFPDSSISNDTDVQRIMAVLQPIWAILPSPEARAAKFGGSNLRGYRTGSPTGSQPGATSLSDLDVRTLKSLYGGSRDGLGSPISPTSGSFSIDAFAQRVQALIVDDKALIERLLRFAQAHDLLKKNAERAQKLAQEGNAAMETYQKQVRSLEERNIGFAAKIAAIQEEVQALNDTIERLMAEKREIEALAADQAETCRQLTDANNTLSARTLTLAEEAASAPEMVRKQLDGQIHELKLKLEKAEDEIDAMRTSEQSQRIALLDELNSMQTENGNLRAQLRAARK